LAKDQGPRGECEETSMRCVGWKMKWLRNSNLEGKANKYTFSISASQDFHAHTSQSEWIVNYGCTHHMAKDASLFSSLNESSKKINIHNWWLGTCCC
jgi:hypothetical protein